MGAVITNVFVSFHVSSQGYAVSCEVVYRDPASRPGWAVKDEVKRYGRTHYRPYNCRPVLEQLLQDAARDVWAMSTDRAVREMDGQEALPGL